MKSYFECSDNHKKESENINLTKKAELYYSSCCESLIEEE